MYMVLEQEEALQTSAPDVVDDLAAGRIRRLSKMDQPAVLCSASLRASSHLASTVPLLFALVSALQSLFALSSSVVPLDASTLYASFTLSLLYRPSTPFISSLMS